MKRNYPTPDTPRDQNEERQIVEKRLRELIGRSTERRVSQTSKGYWCQEQRHIRLDGSLNEQSFSGMVTRSKELGYCYANVYQGLFLLESNQLLIYHNDCPLSLAEAYHLFLNSLEQLHNYLVFSNLNRDGFFCLPSALSTGIFGASVAVESKPTAPSKTEEVGEQSDLKPLFELDAIGLPYRDVLKKLRLAGPKDAELFESQGANHGQFKFTFDVYARADYAKKRPREGVQLGLPDYHVVICDKTWSPVGPSASDLVELSRTQDSGQVKFSGKVLFALVDSDSTLTFAHFDKIDYDTFELETIDKSLPYIYHQDIAADYKGVHSTNQTAQLRFRS